MMKRLGATRESLSISQKRVTLAVLTMPLSDGENAMTPGPDCFSFSQRRRVVGLRWAWIVLYMCPLMTGNPASGLGTSSYFVGG